MSIIFNESFGSNVLESYGHKQPSAIIPVCTYFLGPAANTTDSLKQLLITAAFLPADVLVAVAASNAVGFSGTVIATGGREAIFSIKGKSTGYLIAATNSVCDTTFSELYNFAQNVYTLTGTLYIIP